MPGGGGGSREIEEDVFIRVAGFLAVLRAVSAAATVVTTGAGIGAAYDPAMAPSVAVSAATCKMVAAKDPERELAGLDSARVTGRITS